MPDRENLEAFLSDEGRKFIRIGDLQLLKEHVQRLRASGFREESLAALEESIDRIENTVLFLVDEIHASLPKIPRQTE